jgi:drug/metabolite transporter (DMT)-like permease
MTSRTARLREHSRRLWLALGTVYLAWGSTYLAIRVMVETVPPLLGAGVRFLAAGALLATALFALGGKQRLRVKAREALAAATVGALILGGGIGLLTLAEQQVPSGLAALMIASVPLWVVLLRRFARQRVPPTTLASVIVGFGGVAILVVPGDQAGDAPVGWLAVLLAAALFTAIGALVADRLPLPQDTLLSTALEMGFAGGLLVVVAVTVGESAQLDLVELSWRSLVALAYLVLIGSVVAYSAFVWLLHSCNPSTVATYAYVNPAVALVLGWAVLDEQITSTILAGALIVLASVALAVRGEADPTT